MPAENILLCDRTGVIYKGREKCMNEWNEKHAVETDCRTLEDAMKGADIFMGLSVKGAVSQDMVKLMGKQPIIFAMANPDPEIRPEEVLEAVPDAIVATGRSDYPNQVNNVMGFPYIFRGALDVRATQINEEMKLVMQTYALADLAKEDVPDEVIKAYGGKKLKFGPNYIIPTPFDARLISRIPVAVAKAAVKSGVAKKPITRWDEYAKSLQARRDPTANSMSMIFDRLKEKPKRVIFAEGEQNEIIKVVCQMA